MYPHTRSTIHGMRIFIAFLLGTTWLSSWPDSGEAAQLPTLPLVFIDTTYARPAGNTITVNAGGNLQAAINNAAPGDTIVVQAGATFAGPITLPNKTGTSWIYIQSSAYTSLPPPGTRVAPSDASNMPTITVTANSGSAITTASKAHHYRFVGIHVRPATGAYVGSLITIGNGENTVAALPTNITFDRCYIHGDATAGGRRGVAMNGISVAVIDSYVSDFKESGADTQALWTYNTPGPLKMVNNYLEASGENIMTGGADTPIANLVPSDIEIRRNHLFKPLSWIGSQWTMKNLLEFKNSQRVLVEGNILENAWLDAQDGDGVVITPRNQDGGNPWAVTQDITIRLNKIINVGRGFNLSGRDSPNPSQVTRRVLFENNFFNVTGLQGSTARIFQFLNGAVDTTIRHNTGFTISGGTTAFTENNPDADQFDFRDNILTRGAYGFAGTGTGTGTPTLNAWFTNYTFTKNAIIGSADTYPAGNFFPATNAAVGFVNLAGANYRLAASSPFKNAASDGKDLGADMDAIEAAIGGTGTAPTLPPPTNLRIMN